MNSGLIAVGNAVLRVIGLNPQRVSLQSEARVPGKAVWGGMDYQITGMGEKLTPIEAITFPHVTGGLDAIAWLQLQHEEQAEVNLLRLESNFLGRMLGRVEIRQLSVDEERLHPFTGIGRIVHVQAELVHV